ncbi:MAG: FAD-binding oxidoreductase [Saprospiraceae bacterium]|nr:FAD-binding oxidoreductase [Saprospiraceae bacterium]
MKNFQPPTTLSYWERETFFLHWDVVVIGSGIVGLSAAIRLKELQPNLRVVVLERGVLPFGASTRNAGFACFGSMTELLDDLKKQSESEVWALVERRWRGLQRLRKRVGEARMQYENLGGYELFRPEEGLTFEECIAHLEIFNQIINNITGFDHAYQIADERITDFGFKKVKNLIVNTLEGQLHTGKMMETLLQIAAEKGIKFLNGLEIKHIESGKDKVRIHTVENWELQANKVLVTTNGFAQQLFPDLEVLPARNQVLITQPISGLRIKGAFHYDRGYFYFRDVDGRILLGGGRNLAAQTEQTDEFDTTELIRNALQQLLKEVILHDQTVEIDTWWSGILGLGEQKKPIVKEVKPNVYVAVRLGGMGVAIGSLVGEEGAEQILDVKSEI